MAVKLVEPDVFTPASKHHYVSEKIASVNAKVQPLATKYFAMAQDYAQQAQTMLDSQAITTSSKSFASSAYNLLHSGFVWIHDLSLVNPFLALFIILTSLMSSVPVAVYAFILASWSLLTLGVFVSVILSAFILTTSILFGFLVGICFISGLVVGVAMMMTTAYGVYVVGQEKLARAFFHSVKVNANDKISLE